MQITITGFTRSEGFESDAKSLDVNTRAVLREALTLLLTNPRAKRLRLHTLKGFGKPTIYKIDISSNKAWQVTFELDGNTAHLKRVATHKEMDKRPR